MHGLLIATSFPHRFIDKIKMAILYLMDGIGTSFLEEDQSVRIFALIEHSNASPAQGQSEMEK